MKWGVGEDMDVSQVLYVGVKARVLALDRHTGREIWKTTLPASGIVVDTFVNLLFDGGNIFAHAAGRLYCLDAETGRILWKNDLDGCGYGLATLATTNSSGGRLPANN